MSSIGERLKKARVKAGLTQAELAEKCGWQAGQRRASHYESGRSQPSYRDLVKIARVLHTNAGYLAFGETPSPTQEGQANSPDAELMTTTIEPWDSNTPLDDDEVEIPFFMEVEAAAGIGSEVQMETWGPKLRFAKSTLRRSGVQPENAAAVKVSGNSMEPVLPEGAVIGVDTSNTHVSDGKLYAVDHGGLLRVKMLYRVPGGLRLKSFNEAEHPEELVKGDDLAEIRVIGRVFWYSVLV